MEIEKRNWEWAGARFRADEHPFRLNASVVSIKNLEREIMLINRSDTCRCSRVSVPLLGPARLTNGHAPRNMHRSTPQTGGTMLQCCCGLLWTLGHSCTWCLHIIYIKRATTFCNFLTNNKRKTGPTKLLIILDWTTQKQSCFPFPFWERNKKRYPAQSAFDNDRKDRKEMEDGRDFPGPARLWRAGINH